MSILWNVPIPEYEEQPCECCGQNVENCTCLPCPECGVFGDSTCAEKHGMALYPMPILPADESDWGYSDWMNSALPASTMTPEEARIEEQVEIYDEIMLKVKDLLDLIDESIEQKMSLKGVGTLKDTLSIFSELHSSDEDDHDGHSYNSIWMDY
jgi:hypothetical protein